MEQQASVIEIVEQFLKETEVEVQKYSEQIKEASEGKTYQEVLTEVHQTRFRATDLGNSLIDALTERLKHDANSQLINVSNTNNSTS